MGIIAIKEPAPSPANLVWDVFVFAIYLRVALVFRFSSALPKQDVRSEYLIQKVILYKKPSCKKSGKWLRDYWRRVR